MMIRTSPHAHGRARALYAAAAMAAALGCGAALAQATGAQSGSGDNASAVRSDSPTGRHAARNRTRDNRADPSGDYVPRTGSSSHRDKNGNVVKDTSTGGSPHGRERPPASPPNIPATQP